MIDPLTFRETLGHYPTGVAVVTGIDNFGVPVGMVVGSFTSISLDPPLVAFAPKRDSKSFPGLRQSATFCVNVLASEQESIGRQFAVSGADKFDGLEWAPAPGGSPVLAGVVCWIECSWGEVIEAGDHYIVLGHVRDLGVTRAVSPLMFFQGGYGRFSMPSLIAADADLFEAARSAEQVRDVIELCGERLGVECSVLAHIGNEIVTVLSAGGPSSPGVSTVGQRAPHVGPLGSVFLMDADDEQVQRWLPSPSAAGDDVLERLRSHVMTVRERGYSLTLRSEVADRRRDATARYSLPDSVPADERHLRAAIGASIDLYEPELHDDGVFDVYSIAVPIVREGTTGCEMAVRILGLPPEIRGSTVREWIKDLAMTAESVSDRLGALSGNQRNRESETSRL